MDLKGFDIVSGPSAQVLDGNVAADAYEFGLDVENAGVSVGAKNVTVRNTSNNVSIVTNFTANFDYAKAESSSLVGLKVGLVYNIQIGERTAAASPSTAPRRSISIRPRSWT